MSNSECDNQLIKVMGSILPISITMGHSRSTQFAEYDPIQRLPYDIWTKCVKFVIGNSSAGPLAQLAVSNHWNLALIGAPSLWTTIVIEDGEDELARIHTFLHFSHNSLLDIVYRKSADLLRATLENNAFRIRSISGNTAKQGFYAVLYNINSVFPFLEIIDNPDEFIPHDFLRYCPILTIIRAKLGTAAIELISPRIQEAHFTRVNAIDIPCITENPKYRS